MKHPLALICAAMLVHAITPAPASACTLVPGYVGPNTLDLARDADSIILAKVVRQRRNAGDDLPTVVLKPIEAIKGSLPKGFVSMTGYVGSTQHVRATYSDPHELQYAHPQSADGFCVRYVFMPGSTLLLFLARDGERWEPIMAPFARTAEDVPSHRARWVKAVRLYARIGALPAAQQESALRSEHAHLRTRRDADSRAIADDIDRILATRAPLSEPLPVAPE